MPRVTVELCVRPDGTATPTWTEGIAVAVGPTAAEAFEREVHPLTPEARAWLEVLHEAAPHVASRAPELAAWCGVPAPDVTIAAGNRGSSDAFAWVDRHIGINLQAFTDSYGAPDDGALDRMTRIAAHEYLHLVTYAAYPNHRELRTTPFERALWTMFFEGIGDYVSVSSRWLPDDQGHPSPTAVEALKRLEPELVQRLEALASATPEQERELRAGISMGRFDRKWGSLPVALWLHQEAALEGERETLQRTIRLGPHSVLPLARKYCAADLRGRIEALGEHFASSARE